MILLRSIQSGQILYGGVFTWGDGENRVFTLHDATPRDDAPPPPTNLRHLVLTVMNDRMARAMNDP